MSVHATDGIVRSGKRMLAILVSMARTRLGLLAVEVVQEQSRVWLLLVLTALALIFVSMALLMLSLLIVAAFWDDRLLAIGGLFAFYVAATIVTALLLRRKSKGGSGLFASTLGELSRDQAALEEAIDEIEDVEFEVERRRHG